VLLTLQAINLSILLAKRERGIAALITQYMLKLFELGDQQPEAKTAHLVLLALRRPPKLQSPLQFYLGTQPQPGMPWLKSNFRCASIPRASFRIKFSAPSWKGAQAEPQNPLLLLAKATTYPPNSANYDQFKQEL